MFVPYFLRRAATRREENKTSPSKETCYSFCTSREPRSRGQTNTQQRGRRTVVPIKVDRTRGVMQPLTHGINVDCADRRAVLRSLRE